MRSSRRTPEPLRSPRREAWNCSRPASAIRTTIPERRRLRGTGRHLWLLLVTVCFDVLVAACGNEPSGRSVDQLPKRSPWIQVTDSADWAPRRYAATVAFNGRLWLIGGSFLGG